MPELTESSVLIPETSADSQSPIANSLLSLPRWYALRTRCRHEKLVRDRLAGQGIEPLLPTMQRWSQWKDRKMMIEVPLFAGYCFARFAWRGHLAVLRTYGVAGIVGSGRGPEAVPEYEIAALRRLMSSTLIYDPHPYLEEGVEVEVIRGPLVGLRGVFIRSAHHGRLVISVRLIQQAAAVELDACDVTPVEKPNDTDLCRPGTGPQRVPAVPI